MTLALKIVTPASSRGKTSVILVTPLSWRPALCKIAQWEPKCQRNGPPLRWILYLAHIRRTQRLR